MDTSHTSLNGKDRYYRQIFKPQRLTRSVGIPFNFGFTLLEVLISIAIILGGILVLGTAWSGNFLRIRKSALHNNVALLLERKATEIDALYRGKPIEEIPDEDNGDFGSDFPKYRWAMKSQEFEMPDLSQVLISRDEGANDMLLTVIKQTQDFISKSVKETTISIFVKTSKREIEYSVTTYFVTYDKELSFGGG